MDSETDALRTEVYWEEKRTQAKAVEPSQEKDFTDDQFFQYISDIIVNEQLFLDPKFGRQTIMDRFQLSKERVGAIFSKGSEFSKVNSYVLRLRLDHATKLLLEHPIFSIKPTNLSEKNPSILSEKH